MTGTMDQRGEKSRALFGAPVFLKRVLEDKMAKEVFMPKAGMDMQEGTIVRWLAETGDTVKQGDALLEIETDKVTMEVESPADGTLLVKYFDDGAVVPVVTVIGYVGEKGEKVPDHPTMAGGSVREEEERMLGADERRSQERTYEYRVAVIGGGPAGCVAALKAARMGAKTVLFERGHLGGTSTGEGSVPMTAYNRTAAVLDAAEAEAGRGIRSSGFSFDLAELKEWKDRTVASIRRETEEKLKKEGVEIVRDMAALIGRHHIRTGQKTYRAENIILCCGSHAVRLDVPGADLEGIVTSEAMFELTEVPASLVIVGGGVIGCEMASVWSRFGSRVTLVERQPSILPTFDGEIASAVSNAFTARGIRVLTGRQVASFEGENGHPMLVLRDGEELSAERILLAAGRKPELGALGSLAGQLDFERGKLMVDSCCRTNLDSIFACGDMTNQSILAHSAMKMGEAAAQTACGSPKEVHLNRVPLNLYAIPEAAGIGLTEAQARKRGDILVGRCPFSLNSRAVAGGQTEGFVKVIADRAYGEILGVHIVGGLATEMIAEAKTLMDMEITVYEVKDIVHAHPTWNEAIQAACADAIGDRLVLTV